MKHSLICLFLLAAVSLFSQNPGFQKADEHARNTPRSKTQTVSDLAHHLATAFISEAEKVRAIYVWVAENIRYDLDALEPGNGLSMRQRSENQQSTNVLASRKGVCEGYANLFNDLCQAAGVEAEFVSGIIRDHEGNIPTIGHAWNIVRVDGEWFPVDNTWGAGEVDERQGKFVPVFNEKYFLADPVEFLHEHFPNDPLFQLLPDPISIETFRIGFEDVPAQPAGEGVFAHFQDSLAWFVTLDSAEKVMNSYERILRHQPENAYANTMMANHYNDIANDAMLGFQIVAEKVAVGDDLALEIRNIENAIKQIRAVIANTKISLTYLEKIKRNDESQQQLQATIKAAKEMLASAMRTERELVKIKTSLKKLEN